MVVMVAVMVVLANDLELCSRDGWGDPDAYLLPQATVARDASVKELFHAMDKLDKRLLTPPGANDTRGDSTRLYSNVCLR